MTGLLDPPPGHRREDGASRFVDMPAIVEVTAAKKAAEVREAPVQLRGSHVTQAHIGEAGRIGHDPAPLQDDEPTGHRRVLAGA